MYRLIFNECLIACVNVNLSHDRFQRRMCMCVLLRTLTVRRFRLSPPTIDIMYMGYISLLCTVRIGYGSSYICSKRRVRTLEGYWLYPRKILEDSVGVLL